MSAGNKARKAALDFCLISATYEKVLSDARETHTLALQLRYSKQVLKSGIAFQAPFHYGKN